MALALSSSRCFNAVSSALQAVQRGKASEAAIILGFAKSDAKLMENELRKYLQKLERAVEHYVSKEEHLIKRINNLYQKEKELRKQERELEGLIDQLHSQNRRNVESRDGAERRYRQARDEERRYQEKRDLHEALFFIPIVNIFAWIAEEIEKNGDRARQARADRKQYQRYIDEKNEDITTTNSQICNIRSEIPKVQREARSLNEQRDSCHNNLGSVKRIRRFILEAITVPSEIVNLTEVATVKTESLERMMRLAAKMKNTLKVLKSGGIKTKVGSFKECFDEIADMMQSISLLCLDEDELYLE